jgi:hypothetical protein
MGPQWVIPQVVVLRVRLEATVSQLAILTLARTRYSLYRRQLLGRDWRLSMRLNSPGRAIAIAALIGTICLMASRAQSQIPTPVIYSSSFGGYLVPQTLSSGAPLVMLPPTVVGPGVEITILPKEAAWTRQSISGNIASYRNTETGFSINIGCPTPTIGCPLVAGSGYRWYSIDIRSAFPFGMMPQARLHILVDPSSPQQLCATVNTSGAVDLQACNGPSYPGQLWLSWPGYTAN